MFLVAEWRVTRTDEHGNEVVIKDDMIYDDAEALRSKMAARGHKQFYQVKRKVLGSAPRAGC